MSNPLGNTFTRELEKVPAVEALRLDAVHTRLVLPGGWYTSESVVAKLNGSLSSKVGGC